MAKKTTKKRVHKGKDAGRSARKVVRRQQSKKKASGSASGKAGGSGVAKRLADNVVWSHGLLGALVKDWPSEKWTHQSSSTDGHALWQLGHLATAYAWFANLLDGSKVDLPESYTGLFGYGSKPSGNASMYPSASEVQSVHNGAWDRLVKIVSSLRDADISKACASDSHGLAKDKGEVLRLIAWHEGWHQGQVSSLRKAIGLPGVM